MGFRDITVNGVEYRIILAKSKFKPRTESLTGLDALVLDTKLFSSEKLNISSLDVVKNHITYLQEQDIPIYAVNPSFKEGKLISAYLKKANNIHGGAICGSLLFFGGEYAALAACYFPEINSSREFLQINGLLAGARNGLLSLFSFLDAISQSPTNEGVNAIAATKIKYGVVPRIIDGDREKYSQRAPRIAVIYDGKHRGLLQCLKRDSRSKITSVVQSTTQLYKVMNTSSLMTLQEYRISEGGTLVPKQIELPYKSQRETTSFFLNPPQLNKNL